MISTVVDRRGGGERAEHASAIPMSLSHAGMFAPGFGLGYDASSHKSISVKHAYIVVRPDVIAPMTGEYAFSYSFPDAYPCHGFRLLSWQIYGQTVSAAGPNMVIGWVGFGSSGPVTPKDDTFGITTPLTVDPDGGFFIGTTCPHVDSGVGSVTTCHEFKTTPKLPVDWGKQFHFSSKREINEITLKIHTYRGGVLTSIYTGTSPGMAAELLLWVDES